jgi:hypothetical protein
MNPTTIGYALQLLSALPGLIQAGVEITSTVTSATQKLEELDAQGRDPTPAEWLELNQRIAKLRGELHAG